MSGSITQASVRKAGTTDLPLLRMLLADCYEAGSAPAAELLDHALSHGLLQVAEVQGEVVGFVAAEVPSRGHVRLLATAVRPGLRGRGIGSALIRTMADREHAMVSAVVAANDLVAARLLLRHDFIGNRVLRLGPEDGIHIHYQHKRRIEYVDPDAHHFVPVSAAHQLTDSLALEDHAVTNLVTVAGEPSFEIARFERDDPATLQSGEAAAGIAFSGAILAAVTFLLGFSFTSSRFPDDVRVLLIGTTFSTMFSLIVYASASGELARIRANSFGRVMKLGNVLSEYGGVLPFLISLPVTYAEVSHNSWTTMVLALVLGVATAAYELSEFSIAHRLHHTAAGFALLILTAASPVVGAAMVAFGIVSWPWSIGTAAVLTTRTVMYLVWGGPEAGVAEHRVVWQVRA